jgi:hypothetical protein
MRQSSVLVAAATLVLLTACGGDPTGPVKPNGQRMSARIDGAVWSATSVATDSAAPSLIIISGTMGARSVTIGIPVDQGPGTQAVGSPTPVFAGLVVGSQSWLASRTQGGAGSLTLTTVAPGHVAGTFEFTLAAHDGASPATRRVSAGEFDVKY